MISYWFITMHFVYLGHYFSMEIPVNMGTRSMCEDAKRQVLAEEEVENQVAPLWERNEQFHIFCRRGLWSPASQ